MINSQFLSANKSIQTLIFVTLISMCGQSLAQGLPQTDIWLANITEGVSGPVTKINPTTGYNNQPHFSSDGSEIFYTREMAGTDGMAQTDIAAYGLKSKTTRMVAKTPESEYSPTPIPGRNAVSVIQVEADQKQRLWAINTSNGEMDLLLPDVEPVGYHAWLNASEVAMFILGESFTMQVATLGKDGSTIIADNIGRTLRKHPHQTEIIFTDKNVEPWQIASWSPATHSIKAILPLFPENEDFTVDGLGNYWTGNGSSLYRRAADDSRWELVADYSAQGVIRISRLAINPANNMIAIVGNHPASD